MRISATSLSAGYGSATILREVDLDVNDGEAVAIVGRNGMGKTTLLRALLGYLRPHCGRVSLDGEDITKMPPEHVARRGVSYGPQDEPIFAAMSVEENLTAAKRGRVDASRRAEILDLFPVLGQRLRQRAGTLSGGEQKMLVLARTLLADPTLIVLDEITAGLQPSVVTTVTEALRWERRERKTSTLLVEQNIDATLSVADRVHVMKLGQLIAEEKVGAGDIDLAVRDRLLTLLAP